MEEISAETKCMLKPTIKILGYAKGTTQRTRSVRTRRTIYLIVVPARLAFASQVWAPQTVELIKEIQRRTTKYILQLPYR